MYYLFMYIDMLFSQAGLHDEKRFFRLRNKFINSNK